MKADIFDIYRGTTHDGPGLRTTVFFRGCPLRCDWCHNPEGITRQPYIWWDDRRCIGCGLCQNSCKANAICTEQTGLIIDPNRCVRCMKCVNACPTKAMEIISREYSVEELLHEVLKDKDYYTSFQGGVTVSGGEAMLQSKFVLEFFQKLREHGIHTALDTCGCVPFESFQQILPYTDCILYDLKLANSEMHRKYTGVHNALILNNFHAIAEAINCSELSSTIWVRTPLIPEATDTPENIQDIADILLPYCGNAVSRWELCAFNNACSRKYSKLRKNWSYAETPLMEASYAKHLQQIANDAVSHRIPVILSGILRQPSDHP